MKYLLWIVITALTFVVQGSISIFDVTPNFTALLAFYAGIRKGAVKGMFLGAIVGVIEDNLSSPLLGPDLLSKGLVGYLSASIYGKLFVWTPVLGMISVFVLTALDSSVVLVSHSLFDKMPLDLGAAAFVILIQSLLNAPFGLFLKRKDEA